MPARRPRWRRARPAWTRPGGRLDPPREGTDEAASGPNPDADVTSTGGIRCMMMRGGTSKGLYFLAADLPPQPEQRDALLLRIMGSGHPLQIDGLGGAHLLA